MTLVICDSLIVTANTVLHSPRHLTRANDCTCGLFLAWQKIELGRHNSDEGDRQLAFWSLPSLQKGADKNAYLSRFLPFNDFPQTDEKQPSSVHQSDKHWNCSQRQHWGNL